jgi:transposase
VRTSRLSFSSLQLRILVVRQSTRVSTLLYLCRDNKLCEQYGVLLRFLPLYSLDFNPIKATFKDIKAWIKRNHQLVEQFESFDAFLHFAISQVCSTHARQHFIEAGYIVN